MYNRRLKIRDQQDEKNYHVNPVIPSKIDKLLRGEVFMDSGRGGITEQLPLFQGKHTLLNGGTLELTRLNLDEAKKNFESYKTLYRDEEGVKKEIEITDFLIKGFMHAPDTCPD